MMVNELIGAGTQVLFFTIVPFIVWLVTARKEEGFFKWIGLKKVEWNGSAKTVVLTLAVTVGYILLLLLSVRLLPDGITTAGQQFSGQGISAIPVALIYGLIRTGLSEEILFRGFLLKRFQARLGFKSGNVIQALLFGLLHGVPFGLVTNSISTMILLTILPGAFGWYQGWLNEKQCKGSIVPSWLLHGTMNFITTCLAL